MSKRQREEMDRLHKRDKECNGSNRVCMREGERMCWREIGTEREKEKRRMV